MTNNEKCYQAALDYLYGFVDYSQTRNLQFSAEKFDLNRMIELVHLLKDPQKKYPVIHVAGTKGKGSTCAFIASALQYNGFKTGFYSSPHLVDFSERIQINGIPISHDRIVAILDAMKPMIEKVKQITTFEITTALAFEYFRQEHVDCAVVEVGLGGRLDATNVVKPLVTVITSISLDHVAILGKTIGMIAKEKAGIIKERVPLILAPQKPAAVNAINKIAREKTSPVTMIGRDLKIKYCSHDIFQQTIKLIPAGDWVSQSGWKKLQTQEQGSGIKLSFPLIGDHQAENATSAFAALATLIDLGWKLDLIKIKDGFRNVHWPGRFEIIRRKQILILDAAHNVDSIEKLARSVKKYFPHKKVTLLFGASEDKDIKSMLNNLKPIVNKVIFTQSIHPRAATVETLMQNKNFIAGTVEGISPIEEAYRHLMDTSREGDIILVTGSLFIVAAIKELLAAN